MINVGLKINNKMAQTGLKVKHGKSGKASRGKVVRFRGHKPSNHWRERILPIAALKGTFENGVNVMLHPLFLTQACAHAYGLVKNALGSSVAKFFVDQGCQPWYVLCMWSTEGHVRP